MKNELKKFLTLGAALAGSALMVSCDGSDGQNGTNGTNGIDGSSANKAVAAPSAAQFALADLKMTIETDASGTINPGTELSIDFDSVLGTSGTLYGDISQSDGTTASAANAEVTGVTSSGTTFFFAGVNYDSTDSRTVVSATPLTNEYSIINQTGGDALPASFEKTALQNITYTVISSSLNTLVGTFSGSATTTTRGVINTTGNGTNNVLAAQRTADPAGLASVEINSTANPNVTVSTGGTTIYTLANDEALLRQTNGDVCIIKLADIAYSGTPGAHVVGTDTIDFTGVVFPATTIITTPTALTAPTAGNPVCYRLNITVTNTQAITGSFRLDCDPSIGQQESGIQVNNSNN